MHLMSSKFQWQSFIENHKHNHGHNLFCRKVAYTYGSKKVVPIQKSLIFIVENLKYAFFVNLMFSKKNTSSYLSSYGKIYINPS